MSIRVYYRIKTELYCKLMKKNLSFLIYNSDNDLNLGTDTSIELLRRGN